MTDEPFDLAAHNAEHQASGTTCDCFTATFHGWPFEEGQMAEVAKIFDAIKDDDEPPSDVSVTKPVP